LHGFTQAVLADHPASHGAVMQLNWDKEQSAAHLARVAEAAALANAEQWLQDAIGRQRVMLERFDVLPPSAFGSLPVQVLHGDFHDHQVLWDGDNIAALVDWEIWHADPRVWELIRSLAFSLMFDSPQLEDYLAGYRSYVHLSEEECRLGLRLWWQSRVVGLWAWAAYFLQGNTRVAKFFPELVAELDRIADDEWRAATEERFVRAACD
jgi:homoserine kinase type II